MSFKDIAQPKTYAERCALATRTRSEFQVTSPLLVDDMNDQSRALFGDLPTPAIVIDPEGRVSVKLPWAEPDVLKPRLNGVLRAASRHDPSTATDRRIALARALGRVYVGDAKSARPALERLLATGTAVRAPFDVLALRGRAWLHRAANDHEAARKDLDRAAARARAAFKGPRRRAALAEIDAMRKK